MKKTLILITLTVFLLNTYAQENKKGEKKVDVPELVKKAFAAKYQKVTKVEWSLEKQGKYEAEFKLDKHEMSANFDEKGNQLDVETIIKKSELPQSIIASLTKDYAAYKIYAVEKNDANGSITYEVKTKKDKTKYELVFDSNGKFLKQVTNKKKDND
jgi:hypothetical protein